MSMRTLYALLFVCMSLQAHAFDMGASACDFDALNAATTVDSYEYTAATTQPAIRSEDAPLDPTIEYSLVGNEWIADVTGSIPEIGDDDRLNAIYAPYFPF
jgi:hypothetical protein